MPREGGVVTRSKNQKMAGVTVKQQLKRFHREKGSEKVMRRRWEGNFERAVS